MTINEQGAQAIPIQLLSYLLITGSLSYSALGPSVWKVKQLAGNRILYRLYTRIPAKPDRHFSFWPTPTANQWKGPRSPEGLAATGRNPATNSLVDAVRSVNAGQLNPDWIEPLMGYPLGWTIVENRQLYIYYAN